MAKIATFDGMGFWKDAYVHQRAKLLRRVGVPEDQIATLADRPYLELSLDLRYDIETCGVGRDELE